MTATEATEFYSIINSIICQKSLEALSCKLEVLIINIDIINESDRGPYNLKIAEKGYFVIDIYLSNRLSMFVKGICSPFDFNFNKLVVFSQNKLCLYSLKLESFERNSLYDQTKFHFNYNLVQTEDFIPKCDLCKEKLECLAQTEV